MIVRAEEIGGSAVFSLRDLPRHRPKHDLRLVGYIRGLDHHVYTVGNVVTDRGVEETAIVDISIGSRSSRFQGFEIAGPVPVSGTNFQPLVRPVHRGVIDGPR